ncbi:MAG: hypothetical protein WDZ52_09340 [Pseudohongiellaceae bacterium]
MNHANYRNIVTLLLLILSFQVAAQERRMLLSGEMLSPAYEGWWPNEDGSFKLFFGYMNTNWKQQFDIPVGPENYFNVVEKSELDDLDMDDYVESTADMGQPTHFYPRRNPFLFTIDVPADFGEQEVVWTLKSRGKTARAFGSLYADYRIDPQVISTEVGGAYGSLADRLRSNIAPELELKGDSYRAVRVGEPLSLSVYANDPDDYPARSERPLPSKPEQIYNPPSSIVAMSGPGLRFSWSVFRGPEVATTFEPTQMKTYTDTRAYANSPWSPPFYIPEPPKDNLWHTEVTFDKPGDYILRGIASDGSMFTYQNVHVAVSP